MTVAHSDTDTIFALDEQGFIFFEEMNTTSSQKSRQLTSFIETFQDVNAFSLFYSQMHSSLYIGHTDNSCSSIKMTEGTNSTAPKFVQTKSLKVNMFNFHIKLRQASLYKF